MHLVDWLAERQAEMGLDDNAFADHLGISRSLWSLLRRGLRTPTPFVRSKTLDAFPAADCEEIRDLEWTSPRQVA